MKAVHLVPRFPSDKDACAAQELENSRAKVVYQAVLPLGPSVRRSAHLPQCGCVQKKTSKSDKTLRTGGTAVAEQLCALGVRRLFTVPGETFITALDGLYDQPKIETIVCRHEGGAAMMAEASAKMTGRPGVVFVTRAPGLANSISGLVVAHQDQTPLVVLVGLPNSNLENRGDLQLSEFQAMMGALAKTATVVREPERIPEALARAFHLASTGRPGPVVVGFPEDCLSAACGAKIVKSIPTTALRPPKKQMAHLTAELKNAEAPLIIVGGGPWSKKIQRRIEEFADQFDIPVAAAFRCQDFFDNRHRCYVGHAGIAINPNLAAAIRGADLLLVIGANLGDVTTGNYSLIKSPEPQQTLVHIHPSAEDISKTCRADIAIPCAPSTFGRALDKLTPPDKNRWRAWRRDLRKSYKSSLKPKPTPGAVQLEQVVTQLSDMLPTDAILTNGAGNYAQFVHRYFAYKGYRTCLAPAAGSMGYGLPAAIAAKLTMPKRTVVAFAGDGCLMMALPELATAVQYGLNIIVIIANNGMLGTIRMHQEQRFPNRVIATTLTNPNFAELAKSFGAFGEQVRKTEDFAVAFKRARKSGRPALIELMLDPDAITPEESLTSIRSAGL